MYEVIFDRNGAKAYVENPRVLSQRKIRETWFYEIFSFHAGATLKRLQDGVRRKVCYIG
jgi:hypothetical protein